MAEARGPRQHARGFIRWMAVAGSALLLAACQTVVPRAPDRPVDRPPPVATQRPAPPPVDAGIPQDFERQRVALLVPLTGANAGVGQSLANATQLAIIDTRSDRIRVTNYDTAGGAAAAAQRAIADGNKLILGPLLAEDARAVGPIARRAGVPVITFSNDVSVAGGGTFLLGYAPQQSIGRVVAYAAGRGIRDFGALVPNGLYGERASTALLRAVEASGGQVISLQSYDREPGALTAAITRLAKAGPLQAILIADSGGVSATAVPIIRRTAGGSTQILGTDQWNTEASVAAAPALQGAWFASVSDGLYRQYAARYRSRFGKAPYRLSSLGYDSVLLTVRIMREWPIGTPFPTERLTDRGGFAGLDGAFRFGADGVAERALEVQEIRGGGTITVSAAPTGFGK